MDKTQTALRFWPSPQDYNEAIQQSAATLRHLELQNGVVQTDRLGLPRVISGGFASVYRVSCADGERAVRCFLRRHEDQEQRYKLISEALRKADLPYTLRFEYLQEGISVANGLFPVLVMDWCNGLTLDQHLSMSITDQGALTRLAENFRFMCTELAAANIAHGDLQHGNIIVGKNEKLVLVDYDGMYVPSMSGLSSNELGHRNYQHPKRNGADFGPGLDNFSAWVIYVSLRCLALDPALFQRLACSDDCLLFRQQDFLTPLHSFAFHTLESHNHAEIRRLSRWLRSFLDAAPITVPSLDRTEDEPPALPPVNEPSEPVYAKAAASRHSAPIDATAVSHNTLPESEPAWTPPPEFTKPRRLKLSDSGRLSANYLFLYGLFLLVLGFIKLPDLASMVMIAAAGSNYDGVIKAVDHKKTGDSFVMYTYSIPDKQPNAAPGSRDIEGSGSVPDTQIAGLKKGDKIKVRDYAPLAGSGMQLPHAPGIVPPLINTAGSHFIGLMFDVFLYWPVMIWASITTIKGMCKSRRLMRDGEVGELEVVRKRELPSGNQRYSYTCKLRSSSADAAANGNPTIEITKTVSQKAFESIHVGDRCTIVYDPSNPSDCERVDASNYSAW